VALFDGIVKLHKRALSMVIENSNVEITLRLAAPVTSVGVNPVFGDFNRELAKTGTTLGPYKCLWYDALTLNRRSQMAMFRGKGMESTIEQLAGQYREADFFAELVLQDVLVDENNVNGLTWFDKCQWVINRGNRYKFLGAVKFSLATAEPYAIVVALKGATDYVD
jgi:hypothetical protein